MDRSLSTRTVKPNGEEVKRLRTSKGWRVEDLAAKAECSEGTIRNIERGDDVYYSTLARVARALNIFYEKLVADAAVASESPAKDNRCKVQLTVDIPFDEFNNSSFIQKFIAALTQILDSKSELRVVGIEKGSTIITLEMNYEDSERLLDAFDYSPTRRDLEVLRVEALQMPSNEDFTLSRIKIENGKEVLEHLRGWGVRINLPPLVPPPPPVSLRPMPPPLPDVSQTARESKRKPFDTDSEG